MSAILGAMMLAAPATQANAFEFSLGLGNKQDDGPLPKKYRTGTQKLVVPRGPPDLYIFIFILFFAPKC